MWNVKTNVIPVITGTIGTISKLIHKIPKKHTRKAQNQGTTENSHTGHGTHTSKSTNVKLQQTEHWN
jgi:hypothetical protein